MHCYVCRVVMMHASETIDFYVCEDDADDDDGNDDDDYNDRWNGDE